MIKSGSKIKDKLFYGWVVVIIFFTINIVTSGIRFSFGVFFKSLVSEFGLTRAETSGVYSVYMLLCCVFSFVSGWGADKFSLRILISLMGLFTGLSLILTSQAKSLWQLFVVYSLLLAMGTSGVFVVSTSRIIRWFDKKRGLAIGLTTSGTGLGTVITAPFAAYLIVTLGWRMSYIVMGVIAWLFIIPVAMLLNKDPGKKGLVPYGAERNGGKIGESYLLESSNQPIGFSLSHAFRTRNFWYLVFVWLLSPICIFMILTHIVPHATDMGIPAMKAATILSLMGAMSIPGRLLGGRISDSASRKAIAITCTVFLAVAIIWLIYSKDLWMFYLFALVFGFSWGGLTTVTTAMIGDIFGLHSIGIIMGTLSAGWSLGAAIGPIIGGLVYDISNNYSVAFLICVAAMVIATLLLALIKRETILDTRS
jgi:OFA family oxalate/formate antiporter-like MFS transporter